MSMECTIQSNSENVSMREVVARLRLLSDDLDELMMLSELYCKATKHVMNVSGFSRGKGLSAFSTKLRDKGLRVLSDVHELQNQARAI
jgi:hypothetical protein